MKRTRTTYTPLYQQVLNRLRAARQDAGMTQKDVAEALGRPQSFISRCETGDYRLDIVELQELAGLYGKDIMYLFSELPIEEPSWKSSMQKIVLRAGDRLNITADGTVTVTLHRSTQASKHGTSETNKT